MFEEDEEELFVGGILIVLEIFGSEWKVFLFCVCFESNLRDVNNDCDERLIVLQKGKGKSSLRTC